MRVAITEAVIADIRREPSTTTQDIWDTTVRGLVLLPAISMMMVAWSFDRRFLGRSHDMLRPTSCSV